MVTNGNICFSSLLFCFRSLDSLYVNFICDSKFSMRFASLCPSSVFWNLNYFPQRLFLSSFFVGSSRPLLWKILFVCAGRFPFVWNVFLHQGENFSLNLVPLYTTVSKNTVSVSDVSAVNVIVGWCKFACSMKASIDVWFTLMCPIGKNVVYVAFPTVLLTVVVSIYAMKMLATKTAVFVPIAVPWVWR